MRKNTARKVIGDKLETCPDIVCVAEQSAIYMQQLKGPGGSDPRTAPLASVGENIASQSQPSDIIVESAQGAEQRSVPEHLVTDGNRRPEAELFRCFVLSDNGDLLGRKLVGMPDAAQAAEGEVAFGEVSSPVIYLLSRDAQVSEDSCLRELLGKECIQLDDALPEGLQFLL